MTQIAKDVTVLISHPFCLPYGNAPVSRYSRRAKLEALCDALGDDWELFDIDGILPAVMKKLKDILLRHKVVDNKYMFDKAVELNKPYESLRKVISVTHSCYLWDFGLLAVDVHITLRINSPDSLLNIYPFAEAFEEHMLENDMYKPPGCDSWPQVQEMFLQAFEKANIKTIHWLTSSEAPNFLLETCCWNLIMVQDKEGGIFATKEILDQSLEEFCGTNTVAETFDTGVSEYFASHTGYSGNVSIMINQHEAMRVEWLYKVVAILYSALMESVEPCYDLVTNLIEMEGSTPRSIEEIRLVQKVIDLLHSEANPIVICSESFDDMIYGKVWDCWGGDAIDALVDKRTEFLMATLADLSDQKSQSLQMRLNFVVFVLTIVSVASTVAAIIDLLSGAADETDMDRRALILAILTGIIGLACAIVVAFDVTRFFKLCQSRSDQVSSQSYLRSFMPSRRRGKKSKSGRNLVNDDLTVKVVGDE